MSPHSGAAARRPGNSPPRPDTIPLIFQDRIVPDDLRAHPDRLFLFGDNELRRGRGGQAAACRGHTNAVWVATKRAPDREDSAYWTDADCDRIIAIIDHDLAPEFDHIRLGGTVVCPSAGLGTGRAELPSRAPRVFAYLRQSIIRLKRLGDTVASTRRTPRVLNKRDIRGPLPSNARYGGRPSPLGNPFVVGRDGTRDEVCDKYEAWWQPTQPKLMAMIPSLAGYDLVCFCVPFRCHCDFLLRLANLTSLCCG